MATVAFLLLLLHIPAFRCQCPPASERNFTVPDVTGLEQELSASYVLNNYVEPLIPTTGSPSNSGGKCRLLINPQNGNIGISNYGRNSFKLKNVGNKVIKSFFLDVTGAVLSDSVFDPDGTAGDTVAKALVIDTYNGITVDQSSSANADRYKIVLNKDPDGTGDATAGYRGIYIEFPSNDFDQGALLGFSTDMDPNSIAKIAKWKVTNGNSWNGWDTGGVSGAELIGSKFYCKFADSSMAYGYLGSDTSLGGSLGRAVQGRSEKAVTLTVHTGDGTFVSGGNVGSWGGERPAIRVTGQAGYKVRVSLIKCIQPVTGGAKATIENRLKKYQPNFPCNNFLDIDTVTVDLQSDDECVPSFDYAPIFSGEKYPGEVYIAVAASVVDGGGHPLGPVAKVYLFNNGNDVTDSCTACTCDGCDALAQTSAPSPLPAVVTSSPTMFPTSSPTTSPTSSPTTSTTSSPTTSTTSSLTTSPTSSPTTASPSLITRRCIFDMQPISSTNDIDESTLGDPVSLAEASIPDGLRDRHAACVFNFNLALSQGSHQICTTSNDGSVLYINDQEIVANDGKHPSRTRCASVSTAGGDFRIDYFQHKGTTDFQVLIDGETPGTLLGALR